MASTLAEPTLVQPTVAPTLVAPAEEADAPAADDFVDPGTGAWEAVRHQGTWSVDDFEEGDEIPLSRREVRERRKAQQRSRARKRALLVATILIVVSGAGTGAVLYWKPFGPSTLTTSELASRVRPIVSSVNAQIKQLEPSLQQIGTTGLVSATQLLQTQHTKPAFQACVTTLTHLAAPPSRRRAVQQMSMGCNGYLAAIAEISSTSGSQVMVNTVQLNSALDVANQEWNSGTSVVVE